MRKSCKEQRWGQSSFGVAFEFSFTNYVTRYFCYWMTKNLETRQMRLHNDTASIVRTCLITKLFGFNLNIHSFSKVELTLYPLSVRLPKFLHILDFTRAIYPALLHTAVFSNIPFPKPFMFLVFNVNNTDNSKYSINPQGGLLFYSFFITEKYRWMNFRKSPLFNISSKNLNGNSTWQYCCVQNSVIFFAKWLTKGTLGKLFTWKVR